MEFGIQFFPDVGPEERSGADYWAQALHLVGLCDALGYTSVRTVEHYFHPYGGYSPNPIVFLAAAAMRSRQARLVTGAVLPVFNHPLKLAGEIGMLDAISGGRLDVGFARAFLPHEFARFRVSLDESRARFDEGLEQVRRLLEEENVTMQGGVSLLQQRHVPAPSDAETPTSHLGGGAGNTGVLCPGGAGRVPCDGHSLGRGPDGGTAGTLPGGLAVRGTPG